MRFYDSIKREHLFVFLVLLSALVIFNSFDEQFQYTGLATGVANNYVTGDSFLDGIAKYFKNPFGGVVGGANPTFPCLSGSCVLITADDSYILYLNGNKIKEGSKWTGAEYVDITGKLIYGENLIAIKATDEGNDEGVLVEVWHDGRIVAKSDSTWKTYYADRPDNWNNRILLDESSWTDARNTREKDDKAQVTYGARKNIFSQDTTWMWNYRTEEGTRLFRKTFNINPNSEAGISAITGGGTYVRVTADDIYSLYINGELIGQGIEWRKGYVYDKRLNPGDLIAISAKDEGNDEGVLFEGYVDGRLVVKSDSTWKVKVLSREDGDGWRINAEYDDRGWRVPTENDQKELGDRPSGFTSANWIWDRITDDHNWYSFRKVVPSLVPSSGQGEKLNGVSCGDDNECQSNFCDSDPSYRGNDAPTICQTPSTEREGGTNSVIRITADDKFELYVNNVKVKSGKHWDRAYVHNLNLNNGDVIGVWAKDEGNDEGVLVEVWHDGRIVAKSDSTWKARLYSQVRGSDDWKLPGYDDDSSWEIPTEDSKKRQDQRPIQFTEAKWIWGQKTDSGTAYAFRKVISLSTEFVVPTEFGINIVSTLNVGGRATATISGGTPTYRVAPLPGSSTICKIVVPIPNADGTAFVGGSTFTVEGIAAGTCMIRVTDSQAKFKDVSITIGSTASVDQKPCGELTANECAQQSSRCQLIEDNCVDKTTTTVTCIAAGGEGCSSIVSNGESEIANGNSFCDTAESGSVCVKCNEGFSWDIASENCLSDNPKANGESCTHSNECLSRICSSENVCSENLDLYDFNDDRCVDILDVDILGAKFGGSDLTYDLNNDGKIDFDDALFLADSHGLGDACPIVKGDFNNNRCIENNDKTILEEELAKPESNRGAVFDANADGRVNTDDLLYLRTHYREGGKCALLDPLPGDITKDRCVDGRDIIAFTDAMRSTATGAVYLNDQNRDGLLDGRDIQVIRSSFGGENCPDTVFTYGDFNGNGQVEITVGETTGELTGADGLLFKNHMGTTEAGGGNWDATYDLNADGKVDFDDFLVLADLFGVTEERTSFNSQAGSTVSLLSSKIRLSFSATETVNTDIRGRYLSFNPKSSNVGGKVGLNFVDLTSTQSLTGKVSQLVIKVGYDDQDVQDLGLVENSLRMYYFNDGTNDWELLTGSVDTVNNLVTGITTHLSVYGLFGDNVVTTSPDTDTDAGTGDGTAAGTGTASGGRRGSSTSAPGCNTLLVQNSQDGDCKRICEYTIEFWQSKGYNTVSECADAVPTPPVGGDIPTVDDYYSTGVDQSNVDRDQDGMIDDLEIQYFGTLGQGFDDDFDGDGVSDGRELADGTDPTNPDEFKEGGGIGTVLLIIIILVLIGAAGSILWLKKQGKIGSISSFNKVSSNVSLTSQEKKIVRYIEEARLAGMSTSVIRANLIKAGWTREQINNAFSSLK